MRVVPDLSRRGWGRPAGWLPWGAAVIGPKSDDRKAREGVRESGETGQVENPGEATNREDGQRPAADVTVRGG
jgi:hypothetical protein